MEETLFLKYSYNTIKQNLNKNCPSPKENSNNLSELIYSNCTRGISFSGIGVYIVMSIYLNSL